MKIRNLLTLIVFTVVIASNSTKCAAACILCYSNLFSWDCRFYESSSCSQMSTAGWSWDFGYVPCIDGALMASQSNQSYLHVDGRNNAILEVNGKKIMVASDALQRFVTGKMKNKSNSLTAKEFAMQLSEFNKKDNGFVSESTLSKIAKTYNAKIVKVNTLPKANYCPPCEKNITPKK